LDNIPDAASPVVQRTADASGTSVEDVGVDHGGADVLVAEQLLDGPDIVAVFEEVGDEGVAEGVRSGELGDGGGPTGGADGTLDDGFVEMVTGGSLGSKRECTGGWPGTATARSIRA
jgi:hypothetical protein